jgi:large subunit ribosomal protein L25
MSEATIVAEMRTSFGKGAARKSRAAGRTPAVIYGHGSEPRHITLPAHELALVLRHKNAVIDLKIEGKNELVLVKSATKDVITQVIEHVDLVTIVKGELVHVEVPVHVVGETLSGTTLDLEHKTVKVAAEATHIPEFVEVVLNKEGAGHHVLAKDIILPAGVTMDLDANELIASVVETAAGNSEENAAPAGEAAAE